MVSKIDYAELNQKVAKAIAEGEQPLTKNTLLEWLDNNDPACNLSFPSCRRTTAARPGEAKALYVQARAKAIGGGLTPPLPTGDVENDLLTLRQWCKTDEPQQPTVDATGEAVPSADKETLALVTLAKHPEWSDAKIARTVHCNRTSLYRWPKYVQAREILEQGKARSPHGNKDEDGTLEAWDT